MSLTMRLQSEEAASGSLSFFFFLTRLKIRFPINNYKGDQAEHPPANPIKYLFSASQESPRREVVRTRGPLGLPLVPQELDAAFFLKRPRLSGLLAG